MTAVKLTTRVQRLEGEVKRLRALCLRLAELVAKQAVGGYLTGPVQQQYDVVVRDVSRESDITEG